jgi:hypothetical protein
MLPRTQRRNNLYLRVLHRTSVCYLAFARIGATVCLSVNSLKIRWSWFVAIKNCDFNSRIFQELNAIGPSLLTGLAFIFPSCNRAAPASEEHHPRNQRRNNRPEFSHRPATASTCPMTKKDFGRWDLLKRPKRFGRLGFRVQSLIGFSGLRHASTLARGHANIQQ